MENKDTKAIDDNSGHVSKFFMLSPDSISKFNKEENLVKKMNQDICEITEKIKEKMSKINDLNSVLYRLKNSYEERRNREAINEKLQRELYMILNELNIMIKAANGEWFGEKLDKKSLNYLKLHGSKSLAEEKQILRDIKIQHKDVDSFKSPSHLFDSSFAFILNKLTYKREEDKMFWWTVENLELIRRKYYLSDEQKLFIEIEQLRIQHLERVSAGNDSVIGNVPKYESLKKSIEDKIKGLCNNSLRESRECLECGTRVRQNVKELEALDKEKNSLVGKLGVRHKRRDEAYQRIFKLYHEEHCSLINKVYQPAEEKKRAILDEKSSSKVGKFMLEWNKNKGSRNYEKYLLQSFEREQLCRDERRRTIKSRS